MSPFSTSAGRLTLVMVAATAASAAGMALVAWTFSGSGAGSTEAADSNDSVIAAGTEAANQYAGAFLATADGGGNPGSLEAGDWLSVTFAEPLLPSSLCATWSNDSSVKTLASGVTVAVVNGGGTSTDILNVVVPSCGSAAFRFGTLDLGATGYINAGTTATFGATGTSSTVTWNPATSTLRVVLGSSSTNRFGTVPSSVAVYTPDAGVTDLVGLPIPGAAISPGKQF